MAWTNERMEVCRRMWEAGHSGGEIAEHLGEGLTRNAVIGKCGRMKWKWNADGGEPARGKPPPIVVPEPVLTHAPRRITQPLVIPRLTQTPRSSGRPKPTDVRQPRSRNRVTLLDAKGTQCRWPVAEWAVGGSLGPDTLFCGSPVHEANVYCAYHCVKAYTYADQRPRRAAEASREIGASP